MWAVSGCYDTVRYKINTGQCEQWVDVTIQLDTKLIQDNLSSEWHGDPVEYKMNTGQFKQWMGIVIQLNTKLIQDNVSSEWT